jgi:hypothetical protein
MFGKKGKLYYGDTKDMKLASGYNTVLKCYFIFITDRHTKNTCRVHLTEEEYHNFWNGASFVAKQHDDRSYMKKIGSAFNWQNIP